jgi:hypothetical protein
MLKLTDPRKTKTITLPSFEGSEVVIVSGLLLSDLDGLDLTKIEVVGRQALPKLIRAWNFTDENDKPLPVTLENIDKLPVDDVAFINQEVDALIKGEKKN